MSFGYVQADYGSDETVFIKLKQNKKYTVLRFLLITVWLPLAVFLSGVIWAVCTENYKVLYLVGGFAVMVFIIMLFGIMRTGGVVEYEITDRRIIAHTDGGYYHAMYDDITEITLKRSYLMKGKGDIIIKCGMCGKRASIRNIDDVDAVYAKIKEIKETSDEKKFADEEKFAEWLDRFEPFTKLGAKLTETAEKTFSKFGGMPTVPKEFAWPTEYNLVSNTDEPIPFLMQIDFSEINPDGKLEDFPSEGLLYVFVEGENYDYKVLFYEKCDSKVVAAKPETLEIVYKEFHVQAEMIKTYPDCDDCKEAFDIYCDRPFGGADDGYDEMQKGNLDGFMLGGWAAYIQEGGVAEQFKTDENDKWVLLAQIGSVGDDDNFMWGDSGTLYFYISKSDLRSRNFSNVKLEMQCY